MPGLSDIQITGLTRLFGMANDKVVRHLEVALAEDAADGGAIAVVHQLVVREADERRLRAFALAPVVGLCRPSPWQAVSFPASTPARLWVALKEASPERIKDAEAAGFAPSADEPPNPVFDELCLMAAQGLRNETKAFEGVTQLLNAGARDGAVDFASYLDLAPTVRAAMRKLPEWLTRMSDERAAAARLAYKDAVALADDAGPRYFEMLFASLPEPWRVLRVMSAIMDHPGDRYAAESELARFGAYILDDIDRRLAAFKVFDPARGVHAGKAAGEALHIASMEIAEFETSIELSKDGPWGMRVVEQKKLVAALAEARLEQIDKALDAALPLRVVRMGKGLRGLPKLTGEPDAAAVMRAEGLMGFFDQSRGSAGQSGYGSARAKIGEKIDDRLDQYVEDLLEMLRADDVDSVDRIHAYLDVTASLTGLARDEKAAQIVRRRAAAA